MLNIGQNFFSESLQRPESLPVKFKMTIAIQSRKKASCKVEWETVQTETHGKTAHPELTQMGAVTGITWLYRENTDIKWLPNTDRRKCLLAWNSPSRHFHLLVFTNLAWELGVALRGAGGTLRTGDVLKVPSMRAKQEMRNNLPSQKAGKNLGK